MTYMVYNDSEANNSIVSLRGIRNESRTYAGWNSSSHLPYAATDVSRMVIPAAGLGYNASSTNYTVKTFDESMEASDSPLYNASTGAPTGQEVLSLIASLTRSFQNYQGQDFESDEYFNLGTGSAYNVSTPLLGTASNNSSTGNYYVTSFGYDADGNQSHVQNSNGTITDTVYGGQGQVISSYVGTTESNKVEVSSNTYDDSYAPTVSLATTSGSLAAGTYYVEVTSVFPSGGGGYGETAASTELTQYFGTTGGLVIDFPEMATSSAGFNVYVGTSSGSEELQNSSPIVSGTSYTVSSLTTGSMPQTNGVGDMNLTSSTEYTSTTGSVTTRVTQNLYDWQDELVATKAGATDALSSESTSGVYRPIYYYAIDNAGETLATYQYNGDGIDLGDFNSTALMPRSGDVPAPNADGSRLVAVNSTAYDAMGRAYQTSQYAITVGAGTYPMIAPALSPSPALTTDYYYDLLGNMIETIAPGGVVTKSVFDGAGRDIKDSVTDGGVLNNSGVPITSWSGASTVASDVVLSQTLTTYDPDGDVLETEDLERSFSTDPTLNSGGTIIATGDLAGPNATGTSASRDSRNSYSAYWYDSGNRQVSAIDLGTNGGLPFVYELTPPNPLLTGSVLSGTSTSVSASAFSGFSSGALDDYEIEVSSGSTTEKAVVISNSGDTVDIFGSFGTVPSSGSWTYTLAPTGLMTQTTYTALSEVMRTKNPNSLSGLATLDQDASYYNQAGQQTATVDSSIQITDYTYDGINDVITMEALDPSTVNQYTKYIYGVSPSNGSTLFSNDLLREVEYPDLTSGSASSSPANDQTYSYDSLGETIGYTDQNGTTHAYGYDVLGRMISDEVTFAVDSGVDQTVQSLGYSFNQLGLPFCQTSYNTSSLTGIVNTVADYYNDLGQLTGQLQTQGAVDPLYPVGEVQYLYTDLSGGLNDSRLTAMILPNGRVEEYDYSRNQLVLTSITSTGTTATAAYIGTDPTAGEMLMIQGTLPTGGYYDGTYSVSSVDTSTHTFTYTMSGSYGTSSTSGSAMTATPIDLDETIGRVDGLEDGNGSTAGTVLVGYSYLGLSTIVEEDQGNGDTLSYLDQYTTGTLPISGSITSGGDIYTGLDRFGRVQDQYWFNSSGGTLARYQYGYDADSNVLYMNDMTPSGSASSQVYTYDALDRLTSFKRGTLSFNSSGGRGHQFALDERILVVGCTGELEQPDGQWHHGHRHHQWPERTDRQFRRDQSTELR